MYYNIIIMPVIILLWEMLGTLKLVSHNNSTVCT